MPLFGEKDPEKEAEKLARRDEAERRKADEAARQEALQQHSQAHVETLPKWEYQVKRIAEHKQKGLLGSREMEHTLNQAGAEGWELVSIEEERATFKRPKPPPLTPP